mgnify:CR=1 FL=1
MVSGMTPKEQLRYEAYEALTARQLAEDAQQLDLSPPSVADIYRVMEAQDLAEIQELHRDIGVMRAVKERWPADDWIRQMTDVLIRTDIFIIENLTEDIHYERQQAEELDRLQRG